MLSQQPFTCAFLNWFATTDLGDIVRPEPRTDQDAVDLHFLVGDGALECWAFPHDLSVGAILNDECWDLVYTDELVAEQLLGGWSCGLCLHVPPQRYPSIEALWIGHLFEPFSQWITDKLRPAAGISFYGDGMTWAKLGHPQVEAVHFQALDPPVQVSINTI